MAAQIDVALGYAKENYDSFVTKLQEFLRIPSISAMPEHVADTARAADWAAAQMTVAGMQNIEIFTTERHPIIYGQNLSAGADAPTVLIYGHYDVQSPEPLADWDTEPFEPTIAKENLYARGATDNKGEIMMALAALESLSETVGLPVNIKLLFEGEEEVGSASLPPFFEEHADLLACDFCLNVDGSMHADGIPAIDYALRGFVGFRLTVNGPKQDMHSGLYGGVIDNPIHVLSTLIANLHDEEGRIAIPGIYDSVRPLSDDERALLAKNERDEGYFLETSGAPALWGEPGFTPVERIGARPSCNVLMVEAGEFKAAVPASVSAFISIRLVPDQQPDDISELFRQFVAANMPPTVTWELQSPMGVPASIMDVNLPALQTLGQVLKEVWGRPPVFGRIGGSIPAVDMLESQLGVQTVLTGISLPDDNLHGPNEKIHLPTWQHGIEVLIRYFVVLG